MKIKRLLSLFLSVALVIGCTGQWTVRAEEAEEPALNPTLTSSTGAVGAVPVETETMETEDAPFLRYIDEAQFADADHIARLPDEERLDTYMFLNQDGTKTVYHMGRNVKFVDSDGVVRDKDTTLVTTDGGYTMRCNDVQLLLPTSASTGVFLALGDYGVRLIPQGGSGTAVMENNAVVFEDYYGEGMSLKYSPMLSGVKEDIILESYTGTSSFSFGLMGYGLSLYERDGEWCLAPSETAETVFTLGDVLVYDAIGKPVTGTMAVQEVRSGVYTVTISAPVDYLTDPTTVYPVTIDPTLQVKDTSTQTQIEDAPVFENYPNTSFGTYVFNTIGYQGETYGMARTAVRLKGLLSDSTYQGLSADQIIKAEFYIRDGGSYYSNVNIHAILGNSTWTESTATWNNLSSISSTVYATSLMGGNEWECFDITSLVKAWKNGDQDDQCGFMMVLEDETAYVGTLSCEYGTGENWPYFVLTYDNNSILNHTVLELYEGYSAILSAQNPDDLALTWSSDDTSVATVSSTGTVTGVNAGTTTVRVSSADNSINASCTVYVKIPDGVYYIKNAAVSKYLRNSGGDAGVAAKDTSTETKYRQLWKITYVANGRYVIRPMDNTSKALTIGTSGYISVANATSNNAALTSSYLWSIGRDSDGIYFQQNGVSNKTIVVQVNGTNTIIYPGTYSTSTYCHWSLEDVKGIFLRDTETSEIITPNTVKYIELGESLSYSQLGINYEYYGSLIGGLTWYSSDYSIAGVGNYTGKVTGKFPGTAIISLNATINGTGYTTCFSISVQLNPLGYELDYEPELWNYQPVQYITNCYSYAINNQVLPETGVLERMQPGISDGNIIENGSISKDTIVTYIQKDADYYGFLFLPCSEADSCPEDAYRVALVVDPGTDYHWYRQNPDGTWSHKSGSAAVTNLDASGNIIYDPYYADRYYSASLNYTDFVGYYFVIPLNNMYSAPAQSLAVSSISPEYLDISFDADKQDLPSYNLAATITEGMTYAQITNMIGLPQDQVTFGLLVVSYDLANSDQKLLVEYIQQDGQLVARSCTIEGGTENE